MPAVDAFGKPYNLLSPTYNAAAITPSDTTDLAVVTRGVYVGGAGNITVNMADTGAAVLFTAVPVGTILPIAISRVKATGTTATALVAIW